MTDARLASFARRLQDLAVELSDLAGSSETALPNLRDGSQCPTVEKPPLLTPAEVAELLDATPRSVRRWAHAGDIPAPIYLGNKPRWRRAEIEHWLEERGS